MTMVASVFRLPRSRLTKGDLGVEIEVEGVNLPTAVTGWSVTRDGSLREYGENVALEYVFRNPCDLNKAIERLQGLEEAFEKNQAVHEESPNCGVHVHVNCQDLSITQLYNFITLYLVHEHMLTRFCGPSREGNLFCLRAEDAEFLVFELERALMDGMFRERFSNTQLRYAGMNVCSLPLYGSLEFRSMRGTTDRQVLQQWCELLLSMREAAKKYDSPREILEQVSMGGELAMVLNTFGDSARGLTDYEGWERRLMEGVRRCQDFAYSGDWERLSQLPKRMVGGIEVEMEFTDDFPPIDV